MLNPINTYRIEGIDKLKEVLSILTQNEIKDIIRKYMPDPTRRITYCVDKNRLIEYVCKRSENLANKGSVFITN